MQNEEAYDYFRQDGVVEDYTRAIARVGLWASEEKIFTRVFEKGQSLIDLGTGAGRIALGLYELGYQHILGLDVSRPMIAEARRTAQLLDYGVPFQTGDATALDFGDEIFDGAIFGFNGMMQIPGHANRLEAMREVFRILRPGAFFVFTTHDRSLEKFAPFWYEEKLRWDEGRQNPLLESFGDRIETGDLICPDPVDGEPAPDGRGKPMFIHIPSREEILADLEQVGFRLEADVMRSLIANENTFVREFSDECRFWVVQRPA